MILLCHYFRTWCRKGLINDQALGERVLGEIGFWCVNSDPIYVIGTTFLHKILIRILVIGLPAVDLGKYFIAWGYNNLRNFPNIICPCIIFLTLRNTTNGTEVLFGCNLYLTGWSIWKTPALCLGSIKKEFLPGVYPKEIHILFTTSSILSPTENGYPLLVLISKTGLR